MKCMYVDVIESFGVSILKTRMWESVASFFFPIWYTVYNLYTFYFGQCPHLNVRWPVAKYESYLIWLLTSANKHIHSLPLSLCLSNDYVVHRGQEPLLYYKERQDKEDWTLCLLNCSGGSDLLVHVQQLSNKCTMTQNYRSWQPDALLFETVILADLL